MLKTQLGTTFLTALCAASLGALAAPTLAAETVPITIVAGHPPVALWVRMEQEVLIPTINAELAKTGNYEIAWNEAFSGTLAKVGEELEAVETGLADIAVSWSLFDAAKLPLQNVSLFAPFVDAPIECSVRRQGFWNQCRPNLRESLAHLVGFIMRRAGGDASAALRVSFV